MLINPPFKIQPLIGFSGLLFGSKPSQATQLFGEPEEKEEIIEELFDDHSMVYHYWKLGFSLFFNCNNQMAFTCAEVDSNGSLFDKEIFKLKEKEIIELFMQNGLKPSEPDFQELGEKRISYDEIQLDLYFDNYKLSSVNFGLFPEDSTYIYFPN